MLTTPAALEPVHARTETNMSSLTKASKAGAAAVAAAIMLLASTGCGQAAGGRGAADSAHKSRSVSMWTWNKEQLEPLAKKYEAKTGVHVNLVDRGVGADEYSQFSAAKKNTPPDVVQLEYPVISQYAHNGFLEPDLWKGVDSSVFTGSAASQSTVDGKTYALPLDYGGLTFYYNEDLLMSDGVQAPPSTWGQFYEVAKTVRLKGHWLAALPSDSSLVESMAWQAGGRPYADSSTQTSVTVTTDDGVSKAVDWLQKMTADKLYPVDVEPWSDAWLQSMRAEQIVGVIAGTDKAPLIASKLPSLAGKMVVGPAVTWADGGQNAEYGGSALAVTSVSQDKKDAAAFVEWLAVDGDAIQMRVDAGAYPATKATQTLATFLELSSLPADGGSKNVKYFQDAWNKQSVANSSKIAGSFSWFPLEQDARSSWSTIMRDARSGVEPYAGKLQAWQSSIVQTGVDNDLVMRTPGDAGDDADGVDAGKLKKSRKAKSKASKPGEGETAVEQNPNAVNKN